MNNRVVVGMSGGVDSSVAALLLQRKGYDVIGVTLSFWPGEKASCGAPEGAGLANRAAEDASEVAGVLGVPHYVMDFRESFQKNVVEYFLREYRCGLTPNPCVVCNRTVKWESLLRAAERFGADYIATGHYAQIDHLPSGRYAVRNSLFAPKDQTYMLYALTQEQLSRTLLPVGIYDKDSVRKMAEEAFLPVFDKPDSEEICFIPDGDYAGFIERTCEREGMAFPPEGNFIDRNGQVLGRHRGICRYTVGQRRGLGVAAGHRIYVTDICPQTQEVVLGEDADLYTRKVRCRGLHFMAVDGLSEPRRVLAKIRYHDRGAYGTVEMTGEDEALCRFETPVRAAAPGQSIVFYDGAYVLGGGTIVR